MSGGTDSPSEEALALGDVLKVARLARLRLHPEQVERMRSNLAAVLSHIDRLRTVDCTGVEPMHQPLAASARGGNRLDADEPGETLPVEAILERAPVREGSFIAVPKVLTDGD